MEYSSTKKVRLPGISTLLEDSDSSTDSRDYDEDNNHVSSPVAGYNNENVVNIMGSSNNNNNNNNPYQTPSKPPTPLRKSVKKSTTVGRASINSRRTTFSPTSTQLNAVLHQTAESLVANTEPKTFSERIVEKLDDCVEGMFSFIDTDQGVKKSVVKNNSATVAVETKANAVNHNEEARKAEAELGANSSDAENRRDGGAVLENNATVLSVEAEHAEPTTDESATHSYHSTNNSQLNTTDESEESFFYIGSGEDGFAVSESIHDSDISVTDSEFEEESQCESESELDETLESQVNMSILTEVVDDVNISRGASLTQMMLNTSILSEVMDEEKKEENEAEVAPCHDEAAGQNTSLGDSVQADMEALGTYRKTIQETSFRSQVLATSSPVSIHTLGISPRATPINNNESVISEGDDRLISTSLKNFLSATENNLATLLSSIDDIGTECVLQSGIDEDMDSYDQKLGLTPLRSRLEKVELDAGEPVSRGRALFSPLVENTASETKEDVRHCGELFPSHLEKTTDLTKAPQMSGYDENMQEDDLSRSSILNSPNNEAQALNHDPSSSILDESGDKKMIYDVPLTTEDFNLGLDDAEVKPEFVEIYYGTAPPQSPIEQRNHEDAALIAPTTTSDMSTKVVVDSEDSIENVSIEKTAEPATDSTESNLNSFTTLSHDDKIEREITGEDDIPAAFREMFENAETILEKEMESFYNTDDPIDDDVGVGNFCEDYAKPKPNQPNARDQSSTGNLPFASPTDCVPIDTANLNRTNALEETTTFINLDSLKEVFLQAESQLESASPSMNREGHVNDADSVADTTFDTANFSMGGLAAAADEFFDAVEDEDNDDDHAPKPAVEDNLIDKAEPTKHSDVPSIPTEDVEDGVNMKAGEHVAETNTSSENSSSAAGSDSNIDVTQTLERVEKYLKRMAVQESELEECNLLSTDDAKAKTDITTSAPSTQQPSLSTPIDANPNIDCETTVDAFIMRDGLTPRVCNASVNVSNTCSEHQVDASNKDGTEVEVPDAEKSTSTDMIDETMASPEKCASDKDSTSEIQREIGDSNPSREVSDGHKISASPVDMDESLFMPNITVEEPATLSPIQTNPMEQLQPTQDDDDDSGALSDEDFFPNRDHSKVTADALTCVKSNAVPISRKIDPKPPTRARASSLGKAARRNSEVKEMTSLTSKASQRSHPKSSKRAPTSGNQANNSAANAPKVKLSAATQSHRTRQNGRKNGPPTSPQSNLKPAKKRSKLSSITNTSSVTLHSQTKIAKKPVNRVTSNENASKSKVAATAQQKLPKIAKASGVSPRTSSMRRSLVAVTKSQRQSNIPNPISHSDRLEQLAKPRSVVKKVVRKKEQNPASAHVTRKKLTVTKPPSFLTRESKKYTVKSTEERELEEISLIKPFNAIKIKGSSTNVRSKFKTSQGQPSEETQTVKSTVIPFKSLREEVEKYDFRATPVMKTPLSMKHPSTPSFLERDSTKVPKQNIATLGESISKYDFRATPVVKTPAANPNAKPPSFLLRQSPAAGHNLPMSSEEIELEECKHKFKAAPLSISSVSKLRPHSRTRPREGRNLTTPRPPKLHTSSRPQMKTPIISQDEIELQKKFHARPLPVSLYGSRFSSGAPIQYQKTPHPNADDLELSKKFQALPLPCDIYGRSIDDDGTPFHIRAEIQYERAMERKKQMVQDEMDQLRRSREKKATPLPTTTHHAKPIVIKKNVKELIQPRPPRLSLDVRSRERQQFENQVHQLRCKDEAAEIAGLEAKAKAEEEEIKRMRTTSLEEGGLCFKARPISIRYE